MTAPLLLLTCRLCGWKPGDGMDSEPTDAAVTAAVLAHDADEHPDLPSAMALVSYCPRDETPLSVRMTGVTRGGKNVTTYDCGSCLRTYRVKWTPAQL